MHKHLTAVLLVFALLIPDANAQPADLPYDDFVEESFPFITTTVVADTLASFMPAYNWTVRGVVVQLGSDTYLCFDPDLLRMAVAWEGEFLSMVTMAQVSYHQLQKGNDFPAVLGEPIAGTGMYAGWMIDRSFEDPRPPNDNPEDPGKGPLPDDLGAYHGVYLHGDDVVFAYRVGATEIVEQPSLLEGPDANVIGRTFEVQPTDEDLTLVAAEVTSSDVQSSTPNEIVLSHGDGTVTAVMATRASGLMLHDGKYVLLEVPASETTRRFRVSVWTGPADRLDAARRLNEAPVDMVARYEEGGPARWPEKLATDVEIAPDTNAFVFDHFGIPNPNPWRRNVRPADLAFFEDGRAAVVTFDGDVWIVEGLSSPQPTWRRFASGMYEPLGIEVVDGHAYVHGREGLVRLHDLNDDGEADFYEAFASGVIQSTLSREWAFDVVAKPSGGFYVAQGGALSFGPRKGEGRVAPGFAAGSPHNGAVVEVSADGKNVRLFSTGFRGAYLGVHPETGVVSASDQQGNFVPSTPIYLLRDGGYYGVSPTAHMAPPLPEPDPPLTWIPHQVDQSSTGQVWITSDEYGPLNGHMVHLSYGRSGLFRVYIDSLSNPIQGAVAPLPDDFRSPTLKAELNPIDGKLYVTGFQVWGTSAEKLASLRRLRYTGGPVTLPEEVLAGKQGVLLTFPTAIETPDPSDIKVRRWNYLRSSEYGSGHYRLDGTEGEHEVPVAAAHVSEDERAVLLVLPDMRPVEQMAVHFNLQRTDGSPFAGEVYLSVHDARTLDLEKYGLRSVDWQSDVASAPAAAAVEAQEPVEPTPIRGRHLYHEVGCVACHSTDGSMAGKLGPSFDGLFGAVRELEDGERIEADAEYLRRAILNPAEDVVVGFEQEMPSFRGILGEGDVESLVLFIKSLSEESDE